MLRRQLVAVLGLALVGSPLLACAAAPGPTPRPTQPAGLTPDTAPSTGLPPSPTPLRPTPTPKPALPIPTTKPGDGDGGLLIRQSAMRRNASPNVSAADASELANGNAGFAFDLYQALRKRDGNLFFSPYSISLALAMAYAGARGQTADQMAKALHFALPSDRLHSAFNALDQQLATRGAGAGGMDGKGFRLKIANSIWGQANYGFAPEFLDTLAANYGAGLRLLNFGADPEWARGTINEWVKTQTEGKIPDLLPQGVIDRLTRLVLVNAIYFNAAWKHQFEPGMTQPRPFSLLDKRKIDVPTMSQNESLLYSAGQGYQAVELPYDGEELSLVVLLPDEGTFERFDQSLNAERVRIILRALSSKRVELTLPKLKYESRFELADVLTGLGMTDAFDSAKADFSGMTGDRDLYISAVVHRAVVEVNEKGTEAAAATGVVMRATSAPMIDATMTVDRPFLFLIRDVKTGAIVFVGRVVNPGP